MSEYERQLRDMCKRYGFPGFPLRDNEVKRCMDRGLTVDQAYGVASDVYCGFDFQTALNSNATE